MKRLLMLALLILALAAPMSAQYAPRRFAAQASDNRGMPSWVKWGLVGAAAGAVTFPLLGGLGVNEHQSVARDAFAGAVVGFVVIGGSIRLWQAICHEGSASRRAGLCGR